MMIKIRIFILTLFACTITFGLRAQSSIVSGGGVAAGADGSVSYSIGQIVYTTNSGTNGSVAQGVQQPFEISTVTALDEATGMDLVLSAYPNPTNNFLTLNVVNKKLSEINYQLYDLDGKLLQNKKIEGDEILISMESLAPATYFLKVTDNEKELKVFKIIKN